MIRTVIAGEIAPNFESNMLNTIITGSGLPQRPQRCKFLFVGGNLEVGRRWRGFSPFLVPVDIGL